MAWEWFNEHESGPDWLERKELISYIQDRDLWKWKLHLSREVSAALASYHKNFLVWDFLNIERLQLEGHAVLRTQKQQVEILTHDNVIWQWLGFHNIPTVNTPLLASEIGEALLAEFPEAVFAATYYNHPDGRQHWSLRSRGDFDVSEVAKEYGGGGHKSAAGFVK